MKTKHNGSQFAALLCERNEMDEWNQCLRRLYILAETARCLSQNDEPAWQEANKMVKLICEIPHLS